MEVKQLRKEFNQLLENINKHSEQFTNSEHLPALEVSVMMSKLHKLLEVATVLKFVLIKNESVHKVLLHKEYTSHVQETTSNVEKEASTEKIEIKVISEQVAKPEVETKNLSVEEKIEPSKIAVADKFASTAIHSLKDAFSLNDRYLFANEMFGKDMQLFSDTVKKIDLCGSHAEAQQILSECLSKFNWDKENERVASFYHLVERRFM